MVFPILKPVIVPIIKPYIRKIEGRENIPKDRAFIVSANHASYMDDLIIPTIIVPILDKKIHFYVNHRFYKNFFLRKFLENAECIPIASRKSLNLGEGDENEYWKWTDTKKINDRGMDQALSYIDKGDPVGIFPEGSRSEDGRIRKAKTGIAYLLLKAKVPVLPIGITGSYDILPKGAIFPRFKRCDVRIGKLMAFEEYYDRKIDKQILSDITSKIMKNIANLSGQEYNF